MTLRRDDGTLLSTFGEDVLSGIAVSQGFGSGSSTTKVFSGINAHGYISNANSKFESISGVSVGNDTSGTTSVVRDSTNNYDIVWTDKIFVDFLVSGAGGIDTGAYTSGLWYAIFAIDDTSGVSPTAGLASLSQTSPTLPLGYDIFRRVGWVRSDPGSIKKFIQNGRGREKEYVWDVNITSNIVLLFGTATIYAPVSAATLMPPTSTKARANTLYTNTVAGNKFWAYRPTGSTTAFPPLHAPGSPTAAGEFYIFESDIFTNTSQSFEYSNFGAGAGPTSGVGSVTVAIMGFQDSLE